MKTITHAILTLVLIIATGLNAQTDEWKAKVDANPNSSEVMLEAGIACHNLAVAGSKEAGDLAEEYLGKVMEDEPRNTLAMAYYGSLMSIFARDASEPWAQMEYMQTAIAKMDKAVQLSPRNAPIRLLRAANAMHLPPMFNRVPMAMKDFSVIEELLTEDADALPAFEKVNFRYYYGLGLMKGNKNEAAVVQFKQAVAMAPESPLGLKAAQQLKTLEQ